MTTITLQEFERDPMGCLRRVEAGETVVVARDELPLAEIKPLPAKARQPRPFGLCAGEFEVPVRRMIVAQARQHDLTVATVDNDVIAYPVKILMP